MSNQLVLNASLAYYGNNVSISEAISNLTVSVTGNGLNSLTSFTATTSAIAIPLGSSTSPGGWLYIKNNDPTNYVQLLTGTAGIVFGRLLPGEFALLRLNSSVTAPAVQANTAGCLVTFCIFDL